MIIGSAERVGIGFLHPELRVFYRAEGQSRDEHRQHMREMHKQERAALKADIGTMKASPVQMKANVHTIKDPNELAR